MVVAQIDRAQVRAVLFGHIHQEFTQARGHYQLLAAPATCVQFQPHSAEFTVDNRQPGYREVLLHADGHVTSRVVRLSQYHEVPLAQSTGY